MITNDEDDDAEALIAMNDLLERIVEVTKRHNVGITVHIYPLDGEVADEVQKLGGER